MALPVSEPTLAEAPLFDEAFLLVRPHSKAHLPVPALHDLPAAPLLLLEEGHCFRDQAIAACKLPPNPSGEIMEGSTLSTLVQMVGAGIGVTLIPEMAVAAETVLAQVGTARLAVPRPIRTIGMIWRKTNPLSDHFIRIGEIVREEHARLWGKDSMVATRSSLTV